MENFDNRLAILSMNQVSEAEICDLTLRFVLPGRWTNLPTGLISSEPAPPVGLEPTTCCLEGSLLGFQRAAEYAFMQVKSHVP